MRPLSKDFEMDINSCIVNTHIIQTSFRANCLWLIKIIVVTSKYHCVETITTSMYLCMMYSTYRDEADFLGDRIAIMSEGKLRCSGTSLFLKSR